MSQVKGVREIKYKINVHDDHISLTGRRTLRYSTFLFSWGSLAKMSSSERREDDDSAPHREGNEP